MYTYAGLTPDLHLIAIGVVIWVVAISVAFGVYIPVMRSDGKLLRGFAPNRARIQATPYQSPIESKAPWIVEDLDHAAIVVEGLGGEATTFARPTLVEPVAAQADALASPMPAPSQTPEPTAEPRERPEAFSVLIVDDNAVNRRVLEAILDSIGAAHASVENGLEAVEAMEACAYDAVLMDLQMPVMDGYEATRRIRALESACHAEPSRIIVVSANCADEDIVRGRLAGADCHLAKPVYPAAVIRELAACASAEQMAA